MFGIRPTTFTRRLHYTRFCRVAPIPLDIEFFKCGAMLPPRSSVIRTFVINHTNFPVPTLWTFENVFCLINNSHGFALCLVKSPRLDVHY